MPNAVDLLKRSPDLKSSLFLGLPLGKEDSETGSTFLASIVQYLLTNQYTGLMTSIPEDINRFFRQTPNHPALGQGYARSTIGHALAWPMPKIDIGEQYKHIKPPQLAVREEKMKHEFKFQCSVAIAENQWRDKYINAEVHGKLISFISAHAKGAIVNTVSELFNIFWLSLIGKKYCFDNPALALLEVKATEANKDKSQGLLKAYQEMLHTTAKVVQDETNKFKNYVWYDGEMGAHWMNKADNAVNVSAVAAPNHADLKAFAKAVYLKNNTRIPEISREQSLITFLRLIKQTKAELTQLSPSYRNSVLFDQYTAETAQTKKERVRVNESDLVIVMSQYDYADLSGSLTATGQNANLSMSLSEVAGGTPVISLPGIPPGYAYIGDNNILNFLTVLDHSGSVFHWREEETQYYSNFWLNFGMFTQEVGGKVIGAVKNFNAGVPFYNKYVDLLK